jgi:hypothetical protein
MAAGPDKDPCAEDDASAVDDAGGADWHHQMLFCWLNTQVPFLSPAPPSSAFRRVGADRLVAAVGAPDREAGEAAMRARLQLPC